MSFDRAATLTEIALHGAIVRVVITGFSGSAPRETGSSMLVTPSGQSGTIGGGTLEFEALKTARKTLSKNGLWRRNSAKIPLGPTLGQCCGGAVTLAFERLTMNELQAIPEDGLFARSLADGIAPDGNDLTHARFHRAYRSGQQITPAVQNGIFVERIETPKTDLWLYGAGHVGRAIIHVLHDLPFEITWIDTDKTRFPDQMPKNATPLIAANPADVTRHAPANAVHMVLTYSHALDLEICHRVLSGRFDKLGLIGSATKRARFLARLKQLGHDNAICARLICPIGRKSLGKLPAAIAIGVAEQLTEWHFGADEHIGRDEAKA